MTQLVTVKDVCARLGGVSRMTIWRYQNDDELGFPKPVYIKTRRYWKEDDLSSWIDARA